jgi:WD40 repeat protein
MADTKSCCRRRVTLWDAETGDRICILKGHTKAVRCVALSLDGRQIVSASGDHTIKVWIAHTGEETRTPQGHTDLVRSVAFSPDGTRIVSGSEDCTVKLWVAPRVADGTNKWEAPALSSQWPSS